MAGEPVEGRRPGLQADDSRAWRPARGPHGIQADVRARVENEAVAGIDVVGRSEEDVPEDLDLLGALEPEANAVAQPHVEREGMGDDVQIPQRQAEPVTRLTVRPGELR